MGGRFTKSYGDDTTRRRLQQCYRLRQEDSEDVREGGRVEFVAPPRGFCVSEDSLGDALLWLTIEGAPPSHEVQLWLSAYNLPQNEVEAFSRRWSAELDRILGKE